jgi:hypothetical protein
MDVRELLRGMDRQTRRRADALFEDDHIAYPKGLKRA